MGLFGFQDYNKNGPGVSKNEPKKKSFFLFWDIYFRKFWKLIPLNMLFAICFCSVIFMGPALAGFAYVLRNFSQEKHAFVWDDFIDTAKKNFAQSMAVGLLNLMMFAGLGFAIWFWYSQYAVNPSLMYSVPLAVCVLGIVMLLFMQYYIYLIMVTFDISTLKLYKNSLILAFYALPKNLLITLIIFIASIFVFTVTSAGYLAVTIPGIAVIALLYFSFIGLATVSISYSVIKRTMIDPYKNKDCENAPIVSETEEFEESGEESVFSDELIDEDKNIG